MLRIGLAVAVITFWVALAWGCDGNGNGDGPPPGSTTGSGGVYDGGLGGGMHDGGNGATGGEGGGVAPLYVALTPNPHQSSPSASDVLLAELTTFAAGVRAVVVSERYDQLDPADLSALRSRIASYRDRELQVVLTILAVDHHADFRPSAVSSLAWDDAANQTAMTSLLDAVLQEVGADLRGLVIGRGSDVYIEANPGQASGFRDFMSSSIAYLSNQAPALPKAVGVRYAGVDPDPVHQELVGLGDIAAFAYLPGAGADPLPADISPAKDLDAMIDQAAGRPLLLAQVGITSDASLGSSADRQANFLAGFFGALAPRRQAFEIVNVHQLHDQVSEVCDDFAALQGLDPTDPFVVYSCSLGLRTTAGEPKPAWDELLEAAATFASP